MKHWHVVAVAAVFAAGSGRAAEPVPGLAEMIDRVLPSVVRIEAIRVTVAAEGGPGQARVVTEKLSFGSGFVVGPEGLIMTNLHDVASSRNVTVILPDDSRVPARVVFRAPIDLALLKIESPVALPVIAWGDSTGLRPGDPVIAIGNPLGIGVTVTTGIVSAVHKSLGTSVFDDYLQTDAAINQGNSGGPLLNGLGEVIGISSALITPPSSSGSVGLGFAIPSNDAKFVLDQWRHFGGLRGGWLGAKLTAVNPEIAAAWGLRRPEGAIVTAVSANTPAAAAGLQAGDYIRLLEGGTVTDARMLYRQFFRAVVGSTLTLGIDREFHRLPIVVTVGAAPAEITEAEAEPKLPPRPVIVARADLGMTVAPVTDAQRKAWHIKGTLDGLVVTAVLPGTAAAQAGITPGTLVVRVQQYGVGSRQAFIDRVDEARRAGRGWVVLFCGEGDVLRPVTLALRDEV